MSPCKISSPESRYSFRRIKAVIIDLMFAYVPVEFVNCNQRSIDKTTYFCCGLQVFRRVEDTEETSVADFVLFCQRFLLFTPGVAFFVSGGQCGVSFICTVVVRGFVLA